MLFRSNEVSSSSSNLASSGDGIVSRKRREENNHLFEKIEFENGPDLDLFSFWSRNKRATVSGTQTDVIFEIEFFYSTTVYNSARSLYDKFVAIFPASITANSMVNYYIIGETDSVNSVFTPVYASIIGQAESTLAWNADFADDIHHSDVENFKQSLLSDLQTKASGLSAVERF